MKIYMKQLRLIILFSILSLSVTVRAMEEQSVSLDTPTGKINGKIGLPDAKKPPIVLLIAGSGPTDMDGNTNSGGFSMKNNSLKLLAEGLAQRGIATLRFDKRGIASSSAATKKERDLRFEDYVTDVQGWIDRLSEDSRFSDVFVLGHSEGSLIGMLASVDNPKVKGFISLAGAGRPAYDIIEEQLSGQPAEVRHLVKSINDSLKAGKEVSNIPMGLMTLFRPSVQPYLISWYRYNPQEVIAKLRQPVLILQGDKDVQVSEEDAKLLKQSLPKAQFQILKDMNHVLKTCESVDMQVQQATYANPDLPVQEDLLITIEKFVKR
jgi:putative alpha/beta hydrolase family protein